ncbi:MAG: hypothetical protein ACW97A_07750 [Candidatus Thorarchaeota archaeon]|jgi:hypothetical protein
MSTKFKQKVIAEDIASKMGPVEFRMMIQFAVEYPKMISFESIDIDEHIADEYLLDQYIHPESDGAHEVLFHLKQSIMKSDFPMEILEWDGYTGTIKATFIEEFKKIIEEGKIDPIQKPPSYSTYKELRKRLLEDLVGPDRASRLIAGDPPIDRTGYHFRNSKESPEFPTDIPDEITHLYRLTINLIRPARSYALDAAIDLLTNEIQMKHRTWPVHQTMTVYLDATAENKYWLDQLDLVVLESWDFIESATIERVNAVDFSVSYDPGPIVHTQIIELATKSLERCDDPHQIERFANQEGYMRIPEVVVLIANAFERCSDPVGLTEVFEQNPHFIENEVVKQALLRKTSDLAAAIVDSDDLWNYVRLLLGVDPLIQQPEIQDALKKRGDEIKEAIEEDVATRQFNRLGEMFPKWKLVSKILQLDQDWASNLVVRALGDERDFPYCIRDLANMEDIFQKPLIRKQILESLGKFDLKKLLNHGMDKTRKGIPLLYVLLGDSEFAGCIQERVTELARIESSKKFRQIVESDGYIDAFGQALELNRRVPHLFFYDFKNVDLLTRSEVFAEHLARYLEGEKEFWYQTDTKWLTNPIFNTKNLENAALKGILENNKSRLWISAVASNRSAWERDSLQDVVMATIEKGRLDPYMIITMLSSEHMLESERFRSSITNRLIGDEDLKLEFVKHLDSSYRSHGLFDEVMSISNVPDILGIPEIEGKLSWVATEIALQIEKGLWSGFIHGSNLLNIPFFASHPKIVTAILETIKDSGPNRRKTKEKHQIKNNYEILETTFELLSNSPLLAENTAISEYALKWIRQVFQDLEDPLFAKSAIDTIAKYPYSISELESIEQFQKILTNQEHVKYSIWLLEKFSGPHVLNVLEGSILQLFDETHDQWFLVRSVIRCDELLESPKIVDRIVSVITQMVERLESGESESELYDIMSLAKPGLLANSEICNLIGIASLRVFGRADNQSDRKEICDFLGRIEGYVDLQGRKEIDSLIVEILLEMLTEGENLHIEVKHLIKLLDTERRRSAFELFFTESNSLLSILKHGQKEKEFRELDEVRRVIARRMETFPLVWEIVREIAGVSEWVEDNEVKASLEKRLEEPGVRRIVREVLKQFPGSKLLK